MSKKDKQALNALLRSDFPSFIEKAFGEISPNTPFGDNWHIHAIAHQLLACYRGDINRLIITVPPRYLKSITVSTAFVAWVLGQDPTRKFICISHEQSLSNFFSNQTRAVMTSDWYSEVFPKTKLDPKKNTEAEFMTTQKGGRYASSVGGSVTGRGGNFIIIDDPLHAGDADSDTKREAANDWLTKTIYSRLDNKLDDVIIVVQQRLHPYDFPGILLEQDGWTHLNLPVIAETDERIQIGEDDYYVRKEGELLHAEREPMEVLDQLKESMGSYSFTAQYQQNPSPLGGIHVQWGWFKRYDKAPFNRSGASIVQSWDTASTVNEMSDYSVCTTWLIAEGYYYLLDVYRKKLEYPDLRKQVQLLVKKWNASTVLIERSTGSIPLIYELRVYPQFNTIPIIPKGDKLTRMLSETPAIEAGRVLLPNDMPWLLDFQREIVTFPKGKHDDQIDSLSQFLYWARMRELRSQPLDCRVTICSGGPSLSFHDLYS
jgi:predicted phage terminase large subunit-like protein